MNVAAVRLYALTADREPETHTTPVGDASVEGLKEPLVLSRRESAAFVLNFDEDPAIIPTCPQPDVTLVPRELESILQEV